MKRAFTVVGAALALAAPTGAAAADTRACAPVVNPYPDTRYEDVDLTRIRATNVSCDRARQVARGAHRRALRMPPADPRTFTWKGWHVTGDLTGPYDRYVAVRGDKRVRWRF